MSIRLQYDEHARETVLTLICDGDHDVAPSQVFRGPWYPTALSKALAEGWKRAERDLCPGCSGKPKRSAA